MLGELGAHVDRVDPGFSDPREILETLWWATCAKLVADLGADAGVLDPGFAAVATAGAQIALTDYLSAVKARDALGTHMAAS